MPVLTTENCARPALAAADEALLTAVLARRDHPGRAAPTPWMLFSIVAFLALGAWYWGWHFVVHLFVAIAVHELGHVIAMRLLGYRNVQVLFLPLFGGMATGEPTEFNATRSVLVALAGPAFGIVCGLFAGAAAFALGNSWLAEFAWLSLLLNAFNLLPFMPLDGGHAMNDALFSRVPAAELAFRLVAVAATSWLAFSLQSWLVALLPITTLLGTPMAFRRAHLLRQARRDADWSGRELDLPTVVQLREMVQQLWKGLRPEQLEPKLPEHVHGVWLDVRKRFPSAGRATALVAAYAALCLIVIPLIAMAFSLTLPSPGFPGGVE